MNSVLAFVVLAASGTDEEKTSVLDALWRRFDTAGVLDWLARYGPRLLVIVLLTLLVQRLVVMLSRHIAVTVARGERLRRHGAQEGRAETLAGVFRSTLSAVVVIGGALMLLDAVGVSITTLLGGVAVLGLAVSFGTQNLIKDLFTGFTILLEDQYGVGDVVQINTVEGVVEQITLRVTVVRDTSGRLHFIPHGAITVVTNHTHGWSRAVVEVRVGYREDPRRVMDVLRELCGQLRQDPRFGPMILEDVEMLGVDALTDTAMVIKFSLKTRPTRQWEVQRELLLRIKNRFDELQIETPGQKHTPPPGP